MAALIPAAGSARELVPGWLVPPGLAGTAELAGLDERALIGLVRSLPRGSELRAVALDLLVARYVGLVRSCVRRYRGGAVPAEDLMQVGYLGLMKAIGNFDPAFGGSLGAYAVPCISGELKRYFRDKRWSLHVPRPVQELVMRVRDAGGPLAQELGRTPGDGDLARHLGVSEDEVREARQAEFAFTPSSLDAPLPGQSAAVTAADILGQEDRALELMLGMNAVEAHWGELPPREQQILIMDFRGDMTQVQIGQRLHISQMHVSRLRARALGHLRARLLGLEPVPVPVPARRGHPAARLWDDLAGGAGGLH
jgi:RNA polymerase sigma-B factor